MQICNILYGISRLQTTDASFNIVQKVCTLAQTLGFIPSWSLNVTLLTNHSSWNQNENEKLR